MHLLVGTAQVVSSTSVAVAEASERIGLNPEDLGYLDDELRKLLHEAVEAGLAQAPEYGFEPDDPKQHGWQLDIAWPTAQVAAVSEIDPERDEWLESQGWIVRLATGWATDELVAMTRRQNNQKDT